MKYSIGSFLVCLATIASLQGAECIAPTADTDALITPTASPTIDSSCDVYIDASFILWTARQDAIPYALKGVVSLSDAADLASHYVVPQGQTYYVNSKMSPGFKVGIGSDVHPDGWDIYLGYTWLQTKNSSSTESANGEENPLVNTFPISGVSYLNSFIHQASGTWKLYFNNFDLELGRNFFISKNLKLRPFVGLKGTWQKQHLNVSYGNIDTLDDLTIIPNAGNYNTKMKQFFWGVGPRMGLESSWEFVKNWSFFGDAAVSALYSEFSTSQQDAFTNHYYPNADLSELDTSVVNGQCINQKASFNAVTPVLELTIGARYDLNFSDDRYRFVFQAGWENQVWFDQKHFATSNAYANYTDTNLVMQGLTVKFRFDF